MSEEYLPPIVTKLKGDASDLLRAFGEAELAAKAFGSTMGKTGDDVDKSTAKMGKDVDEFNRLVTKRMKAGETAVKTIDRESEHLRSTILRLRKSLGKGDDEGLFKQIRDAQADLRRLEGFADTLTPSLQGASGAMAGLGKAAASLGGPGMIIFGLAILAAIGPLTSIVAALADLVGLVVVIPAGLATLTAAIIPMVVAFRNFGDAISAISSGDVDKINEALKKLSPSARSVAREFQHLLPQLRSLQKVAQENFFRPLRGDLTVLAHSLLPTLRKGFGDVAKALGELVDKFVTFLSQPKAVAGINKIFESTTRILRSLMDVAPALFAGLGKAILAMLPAVEKIAKWFAQAAVNFGNWLGKAAESGQLQAWLDDALKTLGELWDLVKAVGGLLGTIFGALDDTGRDFIGTLTDLVNKWNDWLKSAEGQKSLQSAIDTMHDLISAIGLAVHWIGMLVGAAIAFRDFWKALPGRIGDAFSWLGDKISEMWNTLVGWVASAQTKIGEFVDGVANWFSELPGKIAAFLAPLPGKIAAFFADGVHRVLFLVGYMAGSVVRFFMELPGRIATWVTSTWTMIKTKFREGVNAVVAFAQALPGRVAAYFSALWSSAVAWFTKTKHSMAEQMSQAVAAAIGWLKSLPGRAITELGNLQRRVLSFFKGAKSWLYDAGKDIVRGIIDGVKSLQNWAIDKIKDFAGDILSGFKKALGISSPAKAFMEPGEWSAVGYLKGWQSRISDVRKAMANSAASLVGGVVNVTTAPAAHSLVAAGAGGGGQQMWGEAVLNIDGEQVARAIIAPAQRRDLRSGTTGLTGRRVR
jgi:phage-related protein